MIRIKPSPMLNSFIIIEKYPLKTLDIFLQHLFDLCFSSWERHIKLYFFFIVHSFSSFWILVVKLNEIIHEFDISLGIFVYQILLYLDFVLYFLVLVAIRDRADINFTITNIRNIIITDFFRVKI